MSGNFFESYYDKREDTEAKQREAARNERLVRYDRAIKIMPEVIAFLLDCYRRNPPTHYTTITRAGVTRRGWDIASQSEIDRVYDSTIDFQTILLFDGTLMQRRNFGEYEEVDFSTDSPRCLQTAEMDFQEFLRDILRGLHRLQPEDERTFRKQFLGES